MSAVTQAKLWYWQRASAMVLALCVVVHLAAIVYVARARPHRGRRPRAHARQRAVRRVLRAVRRRLRRARPDRPADDRRRMARLARARGELRRGAVRDRRPRDGPARGLRRLAPHEAAAIVARTRHPAWWAFLLHRVSGLVARALPAAALLGARHRAFGRRRARRAFCASPTRRRSSSPNGASSCCSRCILTGGVRAAADRIHARGADCARTGSRPRSARARWSVSLTRWRSSPPDASRTIMSA